jgi:hypothetical protein
MSAERQANGRFGMGNRANPNGRPRKNRSFSEEIRRELAAKVTITENGKRKRVSKISANAKQIANQGASGDLRAARMVIDQARKAEERDEANTVAEAVMSEADHEIAARVIARLKRLIAEGGSDDVSAS